MVKLGLRINKSQAGHENRLEYFRKQILGHLSSLEKDGEKVGKSLALIEMGKGGFAVGTIREWKGKKYIKAPDGRWKPKYDGHGRGAKMAVSAIKRKIEAAKDAREMMQIVLANRDRFSDKNGQPLPFVQELSRYVSEKGDALDGANAAKAGKNGKAERARNAVDRMMKFYKDGKVSPATAMSEMTKQGVSADRVREAFGLKPDSPGSFRDAMREQLGIDIDQRINEEASLKEEIAHIDEMIAKREKEGTDASSLKGIRRGYEDALAKLPAGKKEKENKEVQGKTEEMAASMMTSILEYGSPGTVAHVELGNITVDAGEAKRRSFGLKHIIKQRHDEGKTAEEIASLLVLIHETLTHGKKTRDINFAENQGHKGRMELEHGGIIAIVSKQRNQGDKEQWLLTGFEEKGNKEATDAVQEGISRYGYAPEFLGLGKQVGAVIASLQKVSPGTPEKSSGVDAIRKKYWAAKAVDCDDDEIAMGSETVAGKWKLVEADTPAASHDETTFRKTEGFPANEDGSTINDRDYEKDKAAQEAVLEIASDYDMRALSMDSPVVVTEDGVVISGNNRTMSGKIAARKGTDTKYTEALKKRAKKFGFTAEQVGQFKNPRVVFETAENEGYSTKQFARFNESGKKAMNPVEAAVKVAKTINVKTVEGIAGRMGDYDTLGELYADKKAVNEIFSTLQQGGVIGQFDTPQYVSEEGITGAGKEFLETVLIGSVINEQNIRGLNREGCKSIRQKLVRAITPLIENRGMDGYSITDELNKAVDIAMQVAVNRDKFSNVDEYAGQRNMFEEESRVSVELAKRLEGTQKEFAEFMQGVNGGLKYAANGEADIFLGEVESREAILERILNTGGIKKAVREILQLIPLPDLVKSLMNLEVRQ